MTLTTDLIDCVGCCRRIRVEELCFHSAPTCALCCLKHCGGADRD